MNFMTIQNLIAALGGAAVGSMLPSFFGPYWWFSLVVTVVFSVAQAIILTLIFDEETS